MHDLNPGSHTLLGMWLLIHAVNTKIKWLMDSYIHNFIKDVITPTYPNFNGG